MQVKIGVIKAAVPVLNKIAEEKDLRASVAYRLGKILKLLSAELQELEESRGKLVMKYGDKQIGADGEEVFGVTDPEKFKPFMAEITDLLSTEAEIAAGKFKPEDFEGAHLSAQDFIALEFMIAEE